MHQYLKKHRMSCDKEVQPYLKTRARKVPESGLGAFVSDGRTHLGGPWEVGCWVRLAESCRIHFKSSKTATISES